MMTLIDSNEASATYKFAHDTATRLVTFHLPQNNAPVESEEEQPAEAPTFEELATEEYSRWLVWLGEETK